MNTFQVYGKVVLDGQTYSGLLLQGTPTGFGSQSLKPMVDGEDLFDMKLQITGGSMADLYGKNAYMRVTAEANSTFTGVFTTAFSSEKVMTQHPLDRLAPPPTRPRTDHPLRPPRLRSRPLLPRPQANHRPRPGGLKIRYALFEFHRNRHSPTA